MSRFSRSWLNAASPSRPGEAGTWFAQYTDGLELREGRVLLLPGCGSMEQLPQPGLDRLGDEDPLHPGEGTAICHPFGLNLQGQPGLSGLT